jgi:hypothetical protein
MMQLTAILFKTDKINLVLVMAPHVKIANDELKENKMFVKKMLNFLP